MPLYHFNVYDGVARMDRRGTEFDDLSRVRSALIQVACDVLHGEAERMHLGEDWRVEATDAEGTVLFRIEIALSAPAAAA